MFKANEKKRTKCYDALHKIKNFSIAKLLNDSFSKLWLVLSKTLYHILS